LGKKGYVSITGAFSQRHNGAKCKSITQLGAKKAKEAGIEKPMKPFVKRKRRGSKKGKKPKKELEPKIKQKTGLLKKKKEGVQQRKRNRCKNKGGVMEVGKINTLKGGGVYKVKVLIGLNSRCQKNKKRPRHKGNAKYELEREKKQTKPVEKRREGWCLYNKNGGTVHKTKKSWCFV